MTNLNKKIRIGVIFGGRSGEHEVSLKSARSVMAALDPNKYEVVPIGITKSGQWLLGDAMLALQDGRAADEPTMLVPTPDATGSDINGLDVIFPVMHGTYGEDGTMQGLLELADLPYVGAGVVGSATGMDKAIFKHVMQSAGLAVLPWALVTIPQWQKDVAAVLDRLEASLSYPMFTKPANLGSSVGISKASSRDELEEGLADAFRFDRRVVVEQGIDARELEVAVLGNEEPSASVVGEVAPKRDFYDYVAKYVSDDSDLYIPADISELLSDEVRAEAIKAYQAIDCAGLGRVDFLLDRDNGRFYINEINTIPGFTNISMYPKLWEATGISYSDLLDKLVELALSRHQQKMQQTTTFAVPEKL